MGMTPKGVTGMTHNGLGVIPQMTIFVRRFSSLRTLRGRRWTGKNKQEV